MKYVAARKLLEAACKIAEQAKLLGLYAGPLALPPPRRETDFVALYFQLVTDGDLQDATRQLFLDKRYARAVEEAFKCLNNYVKKRIGQSIDGAALMRNAFSPNKPLLRLNLMKSQSQKDEQQGYMDIFAGCMTGVRNPRAHEHRLQDSPRDALELLQMANHLMLKAKGAVRPRK